MKKRILDACIETLFSFNSKWYEQIDGVPMGSPLEPVLANIIVIELERIIVKKSLHKSLVKLYMRYVDDTLILVKYKDTNYLYRRLNSFDKNINL